MKAGFLGSVVAFLPLAGCEGVPKAQYYTPATMFLSVTDDPVVAASGPLKAGEIIGRHTVSTASGVILGANVDGVTRPVPAGAILAEGLVSGGNGPTKIYCDIRQTDAFSTYHETDCFQDADADGRFDAIWTGRPSLSMTLFTLSLSSAGYHGVIEPVAYRPADKAPSTEIGFRTYICWNGQPAFLLAVRRIGGQWEEATGPCGVGDHPGEVSKDGVFRGSGIGIRVSGTGDAATFEVIERIPPGPIALGTRSLRN